MPHWLLLAWSQFGMPCNEWPAGHEGDLVVASVDNLVRPAPSPIVVPTREEGSTDNSIQVFLQANFTVKDLTENYEARQQGRRLPHQAAGTISVQDDRDNGVTDTWDLSLTGCPIQPHDRLGGVWVTMPHHVMEASGLRSLD